MSEYIVAHVGTLFDLGKTKLYVIYELGACGAYEVADIWAVYGIRNDPCVLDEACTRLSQLVDATLRGRSSFLEPAHG